MRLFPEAVTIPGNLIYFDVGVGDPGALSLRQRGGPEIPSSIRSIGGDRVFAPDTEQPAGLELELTYTTRCSMAAASAGATPSQETFRFVTRAPVALTLPKAGSLHPLGSSREDTELGASVVASVRYDPPSHDSVAHLIDHHAAVDGNGVALSGDKAEQMISLASQCPSKMSFVSSCPVLLAASQFGEHDVSAWSTVVGSEAVLRANGVTVETDPVECSEDGCEVRAGRGAARAHVSAWFGPGLLLALSAATRRLMRRRAGAPSS